MQTCISTYHEVPKMNAKHAVEAAFGLNKILQTNTNSCILYGHCSQFKLTIFSVISNILK